MKKITLLVVVVSALATALVLDSGVASANPVSFNGATVTKDLGCATFEAGVVAVTFDETIEVDAVSGNTTLICHFRAEDILSGQPSETVKADGFLCNTFLGLTTDSRFVMNSQGNGMLLCQIKPNG